MFRFPLVLVLTSACVSAVPPTSEKPCTTQTFYYDHDGDGVGVESGTVEQCAAPLGYVEVAGDCDDADPTVVGPTSWYADSDADTFGDVASVQDACSPPTGFVADTTDCDDSNAEIHPGADEHCDTVDEDCDGTADDDPVNGSTFYTDADHDGFGDSVLSLRACSLPGDAADAGGDCDDAVATIHPLADEHCDGIDENCDSVTDNASIDEATWYLDADGDNYGISDVTDKVGCEQPEGYGAYPDDCDDNDAAVHPGAAEACDVNVDANCDGSIGYVDGDADGFAACEECDDADAAVNPGASDVCNGVDDDCDTVIDPDTASGAPSWYSDGDADGHGGGAAYAACTAPIGYVASSDDCDDADGGAYPGAAESCDTVDTDCDGETRDAESGDAAVWYPDADGDTFGDTTSSMAACDEPADFVADDTDCDDSRADVSPAGVEACDIDDTDEDCDGLADDDDDGATGGSTLWVDTDTDGYGDPDGAAVFCDAASGFVANDDDCDDAAGGSFPGAPESCDSADTDCDGETRDAESTDAPIWYADTDGDGYGGDTTTVSACDAPSGYVANDGDCNDTRREVNPDAAEVCDAAETDEDCNGLADDDDSGASGGTIVWLDGDADGYGDAGVAVAFCHTPSTYVTNDDDCDDAAAGSYPGAEEVCDDGIDQDCDSEDVVCYACGEVATLDGVDVVKVCASTFTMGCTPGQSSCDADETVHSVTLTHDYWVGETEVTEGEFEATMGYDASFYACGVDCALGGVSWSQAAAYTNGLSADAGLTACYTCTGSGTSASCVVAVNPYLCDGYRLPTEAEWEGAARCGEDRLYAGSNTIADVAWYSFFGTTMQRVARKDANACGLYDMSGNVYEWTQDGYGALSASAATDPTGATTGTSVVMRGGYFGSDADDVRVADRASDLITNRGSYSYGIGFRLARTIP